MIAFFTILAMLAVFVGLVVYTTHNLGRYVNSHDEKEGD